MLLLQWATELQQDNLIRRPMSFCLLLLAERTSVAAVKVGF